MEQINKLLAMGRNHEAAELIRQCIARNIDLGGGNVQYAHALTLDCSWEEITKLLPSEMNVLETSGWLNSLKAGRPIDKNGLPIPWLNYAAIDFVGSKINSQMRVFEWGAGFSSLWFASRVKEVVSAEDNTKWIQEISKEVSGNMKIMNLPSKSDYVGSILKETGKFDVIVIDGSHRNDCAKVCIEKLNSDGFVIFDNSDSREFDQSMDYFNEQNFFRIDFLGLIPSYLYKNCTSILFRNPEILKNETPPSRLKFSAGISCFQAHDKRVSENHGS